MRKIDNQKRRSKIKLIINTQDRPGSLKELVALARELGVNIVKTTASIKNPLTKSIKITLRFQIEDLDDFIKKLHKQAKIKQDE
jgi:uncharacterized protein with ACT and thioredoxin-like domain